MRECKKLLISVQISLFLDKNIDIINSNGGGSEMSGESAIPRIPHDLPSSSFSILTKRSYSIYGTLHALPILQ